MLSRSQLTPKKRLHRGYPICTYMLVIGYQIGTHLLCTFLRFHSLSSDYIRKWARCCSLAPIMSFVVIECHFGKSTWEKTSHKEKTREKDWDCLVHQVLKWVTWTSFSQKNRRRKREEKRNEWRKTRYFLCKWVRRFDSNELSDWRKAALTRHWLEDG